MTARAVLDGYREQLAALSLPWEVERYKHGGGRIWSWSRSPRGIRCLVADTFEGDGNREFIASAPATVARLSAAVESVLALADQLAEESQGQGLDLAEDDDFDRGWHGARREVIDRIRVAVESALREEQ